MLDVEKLSHANDVHTSVNYVEVNLVVQHLSCFPATRTFRVEEMLTVYIEVLEQQVSFT